MCPLAVPKVPAHTLTLPGPFRGALPAFSHALPLKLPPTAGSRDTPGLPGWIQNVVQVVESGCLGHPEALAPGSLNPHQIPEPDLGRCHPSDDPQNRLHTWKKPEAGGGLPAKRL